MGCAICSIHDCAGGGYDFSDEKSQSARFHTKIRSRAMIALDRLSLTIHGRPILRDVSFDIPPGARFGLVGESGSGKSMTAMALMGLMPHGARTTGAVRLGGSDLLRLPEDDLCRIRGNRIGMIFQEPMTALNPVQTIGDQVAETLMIHTRTPRAEARRIARDRLDRVGLSQIALDRYPHELSGGQRQRACIAAAIALNPALLIADEPTTALDVTTQAQILDLLKSLVAQEGMALLLISHDLAVVADMADHIGVMQAGEIVEMGPTNRVLTDRRHPYTAALFAASTHRPRRAVHPTSEPLLRVDTITRNYPGPRLGFGPAPPIPAVKDVSFTLHKGESLGLVGESGCGKSTLTRAVLGLDPIQTGDIQLFGQSIVPHMPPSLRTGIQVVFQDPYGSFNPRWRVDRIVAEPFHLMPNAPQGAVRRDRVAEALTAVRLSPEDMAKYPHEFSGGQRQRIAIARALITRPKILVLDEAVSALDVSVRARILDLLAELQGEFGLSYLFISHDLTVVRAITDRVLVMQAGQIVEHGPTAQVFDAPQHPYTRQLITAAPRLPDLERAPA
jgi:peptide/nickel transport system ATP-binding protein